MFYRYSLLIILLASLLFPLPAYPAEQAKTIPEFNPLCWKEKDCCEVRAAAIGKKCEDLPSADRTSGWVTGEEPCADKGWGKCLPAGKTVTQIRFGGKTQFAHVGEFIQVIYRYAVTIAAIVAVIMIMVAGFQWVTSGGNSEAITSAKKRIGGALMGLFLAYMSYFILSAINPALVNLRLPQVWMLRPQRLSPQFCSFAPSTTLFYQAADSRPEDQEALPQSLPTDFNFEKQGYPYKSDRADLTFYCGKRFYMQNGGSATCTGDRCRAGEGCFPFALNQQGEVDKAGKVFSCFPGQLVIHYYVDSTKESFAQLFGGKTLEGTDWLDDDTFVFWGVCKSENPQKISIGDKWEEWGGGSEILDVKKVKNSSTGFYEYYVFLGGFDTVHPLSHWNCPSGSDLVGFAFKSEVGRNWSWTDANLYIGQRGGSGSAAIAGIWPDVGITNYISYEELVRKGVYLEVGLKTEILKKLEENTGTEPTKGETLGSK